MVGLESLAGGLYARKHLLPAEANDPLNLFPFSQTYQNLGDCDVQLQRTPPSMYFKLGGVLPVPPCEMTRYWAD
jgi:hypothetical protein